MAVQYILDAESGGGSAPATPGPVAYLTSASFFGTSLRADLKLNATPAGGPTSALGLLMNIDWGETPTATMKFGGYISQASCSQLTTLLETEPANLALSFSFSVFVYDAALKEYFCAFAPATPPLITTLAKTGSAPELSLSAQPVTMGGLPMYTITFVAAAPQTQQALNVATAPGPPTTKTWG
jgi:hypothetical protein